MEMIFKLLDILKKIIFESEQYVIYRLNARDEIGRIDPTVKEYTKYEEIPQFILKNLFVNPLVNPLYFRIKSHNARLLCISTNERIIAYGWIQRWKPFKRKFGWLTNHGIMLGPYWTHPEFRGKGYYGRLIKHSIAVSDYNLPLIIYTSPENISSQRGIEKMDFEKIGTYKISFIFRFWAVIKKND